MFRSSAQCQEKLKSHLQGPVKVLPCVAGRYADPRPGRQQGCGWEAHNGHGNVLLK